MRPVARAGSLQPEEAPQTRGSRGIVMDMKQRRAPVPPLQLALGACATSRERQGVTTRIPPQTQRTLTPSGYTPACEPKRSLDSFWTGEGRPSRIPAAMLHLCTYRGPAKGVQGGTILNAFAESRNRQSLGGCRQASRHPKTSERQPQTCGSDPHMHGLPGGSMASPIQDSAGPGNQSGTSKTTRLRLNMEPVGGGDQHSPGHLDEFESQKPQVRIKRLDPNEATAMRDYTLRLLQYSECHADAQQQSLAQQQRRGHLTARPLAFDLPCRDQELHFKSETPRDARSRVQSLVQQLEARRLRSKGGGAIRAPSQVRGSMTHRPRLAREDPEEQGTSVVTTTPWAPVPPRLEQSGGLHAGSQTAEACRTTERVQLACSSGTDPDRPSVRDESPKGFWPSESAHLNAALARGPPEKVVGSYLLGRTIGEGTFGKVRVATHTLTGECVAVKVLEKDKLREADDAERVLREIHILRAVRHPHIIHLLEVTPASGVPMEPKRTPACADSNPDRNRRLPKITQDFGTSSPGQNPPPTRRRSMNPARSSYPPA